MLSVSIGTLFIILIVFRVSKRLLRNYTALCSLNLPGPLPAKYTSKWLLYKFSRHQQMNTVHALHLKHGSIVQIGPRELSLSSAEAVKAIYSTNTPCTRGEIYRTMGRPGSIFSFMDKESHRERRKRITHIFAPKVLAELEPEFHEHVKRFVAMARENEGRPWNIVTPLRMLALDIGGQVLLGQSFNALGANPPPYFVHVMPYMHPVLALDRELPRLMSLLRLIPFQPLQDFCGAVDYVYGYGEARMRDSIARFGRHSRRRDILTKLIVGDPEKGIEPLSDQDIAHEVSNFIYAAVDTTAVFVAYFVYEMAANPEWQARLRDELESDNVREMGYPYQILQGLPVLQACVYEVLRLHPPPGCGLPRVTPEEGLMVDGVHIPGKTTVSTPIMTLQRNPSAFPNPDIFNPARWLSTAPSTISPISPTERSSHRSMKYIYFSSSIMQMHMMPWGGGEHICAGQAMALMEIKICVAQLFGELRVNVANQQTHKDMEMQDHFVMGPKGGKGMFVFERVNRTKCC